MSCIRNILFIVVFNTFQISPSFGQNLEEVSLLKLQDEIMELGTDDDQRKDQLYAQMDSINSHLKGSKQEFVSSMINSMRYAENGQLDSSLSICYRQIYSDISFNSNDSIILHRQIANIYRELGDLETSKLHYLKALDITERNGYETFVLTRELTNIFWQIGQLDSTLYFLHRAVGETKDSVGVYINLAVYYSNISSMENSDSTEYYCHLARQVYDRAPTNLTDLGYIDLGLGSVMKVENDYDSALFYYRRIVRRGVLNGDWYPYVNANVRIVEIYTELGLYDSCGMYIDNSFSPNTLDFVTKRSLNTFAANFYKSQNMLEEYDYYLNRSIKNRDSLIVELRGNINDLSKLNISRLSIIEENLKVKSDNLKIITRKNMAYTALFIMLIIFVATVILFFVIITRKRKQLYATNKTIAEMKITELKVNEEKLKLDIKSKNFDLGQMAASMVLKRDFFINHRQKLREMSKLNRDELKIYLKKYMNELNSFESIDNNISTLQSNIEEVNSKLVLDLKKRFPDLTDNDVQICMLHLLKLSTKEISILRNVSPKAIQVSRYRIKKKMGLLPEENIVSYIETNLQR